MKRIAYVIGPYTYSPKVAFEWHCSLTAHLYTVGFLPISPILQFHDAAKLFDMPKDFAHYFEWSLVVLPLCQTVVVLKNEHTEASLGTSVEIKLAEYFHKEILFARFSNKHWDLL